MTSYREIAIDGQDAPLGIADQPSPMLQWVEIAQMVIDDRYQRPLGKHSLTTIRAIAANFRWSCFAPVLLAPIEGGRFAVIDGQHRVHAALLCGLKSVPAMVVPIAATEQARAFVAVNTARTGVSVFSIFKAGLASGEAWAIAASEAVAAADCRLMSFNPSAASKKPGDVYCVGLIRDMVKSGRAGAVTVTLSAIRAIDIGGSSSVLLYSDWLLNPLIKAVAEVPEADVETVVAALRRKRPFIVMEQAKRVADSEKRPMSTVARAMFLALLHDQMRGVAA